MIQKNKDKIDKFYEKSNPINKDKLKKKNKEKSNNLNNNKVIRDQLNTNRMEQFN